MTQDLYIDCQVFQTEAWHRGMGKYSLSLLSALNDGLQKRYKNIYIVLNDNLPFHTEAKDGLMKAIPQAKSMELDLELPQPHVKLHETRRKNRQILDSNIESLSYDYLIPALFIDEACIIFPSANKKLLVFYDLIPFLYHERYENRINFENYLDHFATIYEADGIFTISQTVSDDIAVYLGINKNKLFTIDGASIDRSSKTSKKPKLSLKENNYILMPTGDELRKNNLRGVQGFKIFNETNNNKYKLIVTSRISDHTREELSSVTPNITFSGNVSEAELQWLYENAAAVLFPTEYEGLGLPILEAMSANKKVACSNIPVFREISLDLPFYFDYNDPLSIAHQLNVALQDEAHEERKGQYKKVLQRYTWKTTAKKFFNGLSSIVETKNQQNKRKIAIFTPDPSGFSAIGKVTAETHDAISDLFEVDYYFDKGVYHQKVRPEFLSHIANVYDAKTFNARTYADYEAVIYHIGNSDYHLETIKNALHLPGIAILHDTHLNGAYSSLRNLDYISTERYELEENLGMENKELSEFLFSVAKNQISLIVHSNFAKKATSEITNEKNCSVVQLPVETPKITKPINNTFQIGLAGIIADVKGLKIIENIASSAHFEDAEISIFGHSFAKPDVKAVFDKWPNVSVYPDPSDLEFQTRLSGLDALVNYRLEYRGETSLTTLEAMRYGIPVIVRDIGWYSELPRDAVLQTKSIKEVLGILEQLKNDVELRKKIGEEAKQYVRSKHTHQQYAEKLDQLISSDNKTSNEAVLGLVKELRQKSNIKDIINNLS